MPGILDTLLGREAYGPILPGMTVDRQPSSNAPSILDTLLGGGGDPANPLDPATMRRHQFTDGLAGLSRGLLAAGGPSLMPMDFGSALGKGLSEGLAARDSGEDRYLKRALVGSQVQQAQATLAGEKAWQDLLKKGNAAGGVAVPAPSTPVGTPTPLAGGAAPTGSLPADWDPHYHKASASTGLSIDLLKAKDLVESGGNANAVSPAGAAGPAQLMPGTAADLGVTNAKDPGQAIPAGANYLKQQYDKYKNADIALMAYNWGPGNVDNWIRTGADPKAVPAETRNYLAKIHAKLGTAPPTFAAATPQAPPGAPPMGPIAQPPVQLASAGGPPPAAAPAMAPPPTMPPQGDAAPTGGVQIAQAAPVQPPASAVPAAPAAAPVRTFAEVIGSIPPAAREVLATMPRKEGMAYILGKYVSPETEPAIDTTTGEVVFAPKNDTTGRYKPVAGAQLGLDRKKFEFEQEKFATEQKQKGQFVRGPDGVQRWVPASGNSAGLQQFDKPPDAGGEAGDTFILDKSFKDPNYVNSPEYAAAYNRRAEPKMSQSGQLQYPDMSAYQKPGGGQSTAGTQFKDTQASQFTMAGKLADDFNQNEQVKKYRVIEPLYSSMKDAATRNNRVADQNMIYAMATIFDPGSVVRDGERIAITNGQALPDWLKGQINAFNGGSALVPKYKQQMLDEAGSRYGSLRTQHDEIANQYSDRAKRYGLDPRDVITYPGTPAAAGTAPKQGGQKFRLVPGKGLVAE